MVISLKNAYPSLKYQSAQLVCITSGSTRSMKQSQLLKFLSLNPIILGLALCNFSISYVISNHNAGFDVWMLFTGGDYIPIISYFVLGVYCITIGFSLMKGRFWAVKSYAIIHIFFCIILLVLGLDQLFDALIYEVDSEYMFFMSVYLLIFSYTFATLLILIGIVRERKNDE